MTRKGRIRLVVGAADGRAGLFGHRVWSPSLGRSLAAGQSIAVTSAEIEAANHPLRRRLRDLPIQASEVFEPRWGGSCRVQVCPSAAHGIRDCRERQGSRTRARNSSARLGPPAWSSTLVGLLCHAPFPKQGRTKPKASDCVDPRRDKPRGSLFTFPPVWSHLEFVWRVRDKGLWTERAR